MKTLSLVAALAAAIAFDALAAGGDSHPGYGVVESVKKLSPADTPSASTGASTPNRAPNRGSARYLVTVRLDDGTVQIRTVRRLEVRKGERVLVTNAGDVVPD